MEKLVKVSWQTAWQLLAKLTTSLSTFFILALVARYYGESGVGVFTLALAFLAFFYLAADLGFNAGLLSKVQEQGFSPWWQKLLGQRLVLSGLALVIADLAAYFWPGLDPLFRQSVWIGSWAIFGSSIFITSSLIFQIKQRFLFLTIAQIGGSLITLLTIYLLSTRYYPAPMLMIAHVFGWFVCGGIALRLAKNYTSIRPVLDLGFIRKVILDYWPISLTLLLNVVYFRIDAFILAAHFSLAEVGTYNLAYQVFQSVLVLPTYIMNSFYPIMVADKIKVLKPALLLIGLAVLATLATFLLTPWVIALISGGKGFLGSVLALRILSLGFPAFFASSVLMWKLIAGKQIKMMLVIYLIGLAVNITLNLLIIPTYSYIGASSVTVFSEYLILLLQVIILTGKRKKVAV